MPKATAPVPESGEPRRHVSPEEAVSDLLPTLAVEVDLLKEFRTKLAAQIKMSMVIGGAILAIVTSLATWASVSLIDLGKQTVDLNRNLSGTADKILTKIEGNFQTTAAQIDKAKAEVLQSMTTQLADSNKSNDVRFREVKDGIGELKVSLGELKAALPKTARTGEPMISVPEPGQKKTAAAEHR